MDSDEIRYLSENCIHLKRFLWSFLADNFPKLTRERFIIVKTSSLRYGGSHLRVLLFQKSKAYLADLLVIPIKNYQILYCRLEQIYNEVHQILKLKPIQNQNSKRCGLFDFFAHVMLGQKYLFMLKMNDNDLLPICYPLLIICSSIFN